jgi:hypothetical protein
MKPAGKTVNKRKNPYLLKKTVIFHDFGVGDKSFFDFFVAY